MVLTSAFTKSGNEDVHTLVTTQFAEAFLRLEDAEGSPATDHGAITPALHAALHATVVTYKSPAECVEKARWLLDHPTERAAIAKAGQRRVLSEHTYSHRAHELDRLIQRELAAGRGR